MISSSERTHTLSPRQYVSVSQFNYRECDHLVPNFFLLLANLPRDRWLMPTSCFAAVPPLHASSRIVPFILLVFRPPTPSPRTLYKIAKKNRLLNLLHVNCITLLTATSVVFTFCVIECQFLVISPDIFIATV